MIDKNELKLNKNDYISKTLKSIFGAVPYGGAVFIELIDVLIPKQRLDRVIDFIIKLHEKYKNIEEECKNNQQAIFYLEEGIRLSSRANYEKKRYWISCLIGEGIYENVTPDLMEKYLLIMDEISKEQIIILLYYSINYYDENKLKKNWKMNIRR